MCAQFNGTWLCGSYVDVPGGPTDRIRKTLDMVSSPLVIGGGEWRRDGVLHQRDWLVPVTREIQRDFTGLPTGAESGTAYWHFAARQVRGHALARRISKSVEKGMEPDLPYDVWADEDRRYVHQVLQTKAVTIPFMWGVPTAFALEFFSGIPHKHYDLMVDALVGRINAILAQDPSTVIQMELPAELAFVSFGLSHKQKEAIAKRMAKLLGHVLRRLPAGTRVALHLCWGDLNNRPFVPRMMQRQFSKMILINAILALNVWGKDGCMLYAIHDPECDGKHDPTTKDKVYRTWKHMHALPQETIFALGVLKHTLTPDTVVQTAETIANWVPAQHFALAANCGDGRKKLRQVEQQYEIGGRALERLAA